MNGTPRQPSERRDDFIRSAEELFVERGFENISVEDIVGRAGTAKGLFYLFRRSSSWEHGW